MQPPATCDQPSPPPVSRADGTARVPRAFRTPQSQSQRRRPRAEHVGDREPCPRGRNHWLRTDRGWALGGLLSHGQTGPLRRAPCRIDDEPGRLARQRRRRQLRVSTMSPDQSVKDVSDAPLREICAFRSSTGESHLLMFRAICVNERLWTCFWDNSGSTHCGCTCTRLQ